MKKITHKMKHIELENDRVKLMPLKVGDIEALYMISRKIQDCWLTVHLIYQPGKICITILKQLFSKDTLMLSTISYLRVLPDAPVLETFQCPTGGWRLDGPG